MNPTEPTPTTPNHNPSRRADPPPPTTSPGPDELNGDEARLYEARDQLSHHVDDRWVEVSDRIIWRALNATRRSAPIRTAHQNPTAPNPLGQVFLSEEVLTAHLRDAIAQVPAAAPSRIHVHADGNHNYSGITIEITVQYPEAIIPIADEIREHTQQVLHQLLGTEIPTVTINTMHVHVSDITTNDPHTGRPPKPSGAEGKP